MPIKGDIIFLPYRFKKIIYAIGVIALSSLPIKADERRTISHAMGTTKVPTHPKRVVILTNEGTEALLSLGIKPIGAVKSWTGKPWYKHIKDQMQGIKVLGTETQINLEALAILEPDLIIGNKMRQEKLYRTLSMIAPTVFASTLRGAWRSNFELYANALNRVDKGAQLLDKFDKEVKDLRQRHSDKLKLKISVIRFLPGQTRIYMKNSFSGVILDNIGFARTPSQDKSSFAEQISKEQIQKADGDIIFYFTYDNSDKKSRQREKEWLNNPLFKQLNAVKNGKVFKVSDTIWNTSGGIISANLMIKDLNNFLKRP